MDLKSKIKQFGVQIGITKIGVCQASYDEVLASRLKARWEHFGKNEFEIEDIEKRVNPSLTLEDAKSVIVCLFPYYMNNVSKTNLSRYAMLLDYHNIAKQKMQTIVEYIEGNVNKIKYKIYVDNGPLVDRHLAYKAGLGFWGRNNQLINDEFGSYFFIGYIITDLELDPDAEQDKTCLGCGACIKNCPNGALKENFSMDANQCVSYLTQKKSITPSEQELLSRLDTVFGCDICQECCPHNQTVADTPIEEFHYDIIDGLSYHDLSKMSNREFQKLYGKYPFSWRGKNTILKNFSQQKSKNRLDK